MALTQTDLEKIGQLVKSNIETNNKHIGYLIDIKTEDLEERLTQKIQQSKSDILDAIDPILKEVMANREERTIINHRLTKLEEKYAS